MSCHPLEVLRLVGYLLDPPYGRTNALNQASRIAETRSNWFSRELQP